MTRAPDFGTIALLDVPVACVTTLDILHIVAAWIAESIAESDAQATPPVPRLITYVNAHCLNTASTTPAYHALLKQADLVYPDGISVVWVSRLLGAERMQKSTGADWIALFCALAAAHGWRVYILAGRPGIARAARDTLQARQPALQIVGAYDGFFTEKSEPEILADIAACQPHVVFVGMGTPRQEIWLERHRSAIHAPICWSVGALFDYVAGVEPRVPPWMNRLALEWLWRLGVDPVGKWKRYIFGNPLFVYRVLRYLAKRLNA